jgi:hypothetical protein
MGFNVLLEILRAFESLLAEIALVRLEWYVNTDVRCDVIALDGRSAAVAPSTRQVEIVGRLATNMTFTHMILEGKLEGSLQVVS